jgi:hypothetical protein
VRTKRATTPKIRFDGAAVILLRKTIEFSKASWYNDTASLATAKKKPKDTHLFFPPVEPRIVRRGGKQKKEIFSRKTNVWGTRRGRYKLFALSNDSPLGISF